LPCGYFGSAEVVAYNQLAGYNHQFLLLVLM